MSGGELREGARALSPRTFAIAHQRPKQSFVGCSRITDYEILNKLGEGTFGYDLGSQSSVFCDYNV
jgi:serine/threonine-protein kinase BUR1